MEVKLKDIANKTGVSISTVSRILSGDSTRKSREDTVKKVIDCATELGYFKQKTFIMPQFLQKSLNLVCIFTSDHEDFVSPFFSKILVGIQEELKIQGQKFKINFSTLNINDKSSYEFIKDNSFDCAILLGRTSESTINFIKDNIPYLIYSGLNRIGKDFDEILCDAYEGVIFAVNYLKELGHEEIGYIGPVSSDLKILNEHRFEGYLQGLKLNNLVYKKNLVKDSFLSAADGYESIKELHLSNNLGTAIICGNDTVAMGVLRYLAECNIKVPQQVSVIGFDDIESGAYMKPALTTIGVPKKDLGRYAVKILIDQIESNRTYPIQVKIPFKLIERESCFTLKK